MQVAGSAGKCKDWHIDLPRTGQTKCYDSAGTEIPCTGTGQDGEIQAGVAWPEPRFAITYCDSNGPCANQTSDCDSNESTDIVTDNLTGLVWARNGDLPNGIMPWQQAIDYANNLNLCGYSDWRLPNVNELESLSNAGELAFSLPDSEVWLNTQGFSTVHSGFYWSSTTSADGTGNAWIVHVLNGYPLGAEKGGGFYVWLVRAGQNSSIDSLYPANIYKTGQTASYATGDDGDLERGVAWPVPRFYDNANGTITDNLTGLVWLKDANCIATKYPSFDNDWPSGDGMVTWQHALDFVAGMNNGTYSNCSGGYSDWRLPNRNEFRSLIDYSNYNPALPSGHPFTNVQSGYPDSWLWYWSSTSITDFAYNVGIVYLGWGYVSYVNKDYFNYVWPVHGGVLLNPDISVTPTSHDFSSINVGSSSAPQTFTISNTGTADLIVSSIDLSDITNYTIDKTGCGILPATITPGSNCTVSVTFSPSSTGQKDANLTINSDDPDTPTLNVPLSGTGVQQCFNNLNCNSGYYCKKAESGCNSAGVCAVKPEYCITLYAPVCGCDGRTYSNECVAAQAGVSVAYQGECVVPLPDISVSPTSHDFGYVSVGCSSAPQMFTISNTGTVDLVIGTLTLAGPSAFEFHIQNDHCSSTTLAPSGSCTVQVRFLPTTVMTLSNATLSIPSNDPDPGENPLNVPLRGTGSAPDFPVFPPSYNFGNVVVSSSSAAQTFTFSNTGCTNLSIYTITITGTDANQFSKQNDYCSGTTLAPFGSCTVKVVFSPISAGGKTANLFIPSDVPTLVPLSGTGILPAVTCSFTAYGTHLSRGSNLKFLAAVQNDTDQVQVFQFATSVTLPNGDRYPSSGWLLGPITVTLNPHTSTSKSLTQFIPYNAPFGTYTYHGYVGKASPPLLYNQCQFNFTVNP